MQGICAYDVIARVLRLWVPGEGVNNALARCRHLTKELESDGE